MTDDVYPRDRANRYRLYAVRGVNDRDVLATAPDPAGIGVAIVQLHEDEKEMGKRLDDLGRIGLMDTMPNGEPSETGEWIVTPWPRGAHV